MESFLSSWLHPCVLFTLLVPLKASKSHRSLSDISKSRQVCPCLTESGLWLLHWGWASAPQAALASPGMRWEPWALLVSGSPMKGISIRKASRYKSSAKFKLHLSTTKNVQFSANNKTFIHFHAPIFCFPLLKCSLCWGWIFQAPVALCR